MNRHQSDRQYVVDHTLGTYLGRTEKDNRLLVSILEGVKRNLDTGFWVLEGGDKDTAAARLIESVLHGAKYGF